MEKQGKDPTRKGQNLKVLRSRASQGKPCIWMEAGVVNFKICDMNYDCRSCSFDKAMSAAIRKDSERFASWREKLMSEGTYRERPCRHALTGEIPARLCSHNYDCAACCFDQGLEAQSLSGDFTHPRTIEAVGVTVAEDTSTHPGHTWARVEYGGLVRIGVDDFASRLFGPLDHFHPPKLGTDLEAGSPGWSGVRGGREAHYLSPISGVVMAVNGLIKAEPQRVLNDPFGSGWVAVLMPRRLKKELQGLMDLEKVRNWLEMESMKLGRLVFGDYPVQLAATGGEMMRDVYGNAPGLDWDVLVRVFLRADWT